MTDLEKDTSKIVIAIRDTVFSLKKSALKIFEEYLKTKNSVIYDSLQKSKGNYKLKLTELTKDSIFNYKYLSEFPKGRDIWRNKYPFHLNGIIGVSRIYFDQSKKYGMFVYTVTCGRLCGGITRCFIKNKNGSWEIEKSELLSVF